MWGRDYYQPESEVGQPHYKSVHAKCQVIPDNRLVWNRNIYFVIVDLITKLLNSSIRLVYIAINMLC